MCFGGGSQSTPQPAAAPAAAPAPAEPGPTEGDLTAARSREEDSTFGARGPQTRVDRSASGGVQGGSGLGGM